MNAQWQLYCGYSLGDNSDATPPHGCFESSHNEPGKRSARHDTSHNRTKHRNGMAATHSLIQRWSSIPPHPLGLSIKWCPLRCDLWRLKQKQPNTNKAKKWMKGRWRRMGMGCPEIAKYSPTHPLKVLVTRSLTLARSTTNHLARTVALMGISPEWNIGSQIAGNEFICDDHGQRGRGVRLVLPSPWPSWIVLGLTVDKNWL